MNVKGVTGSDKATENCDHTVVSLSSQRAFLNHLSAYCFSFTAHSFTVLIHSQTYFFTLCDIFQELLESNQKELIHNMHMLHI